MNDKKLNGWNNNLTPLDGVGGKPGYHEKLPTMTPEQQKAKEILIKYISIIGSECEHDSYCDRPECNKLGYTFCHVDYKTAKACAINEVKAILEELPELVYGVLQDAPHQKIAVDNPRIIHWKQVLTEIEKI